MTAHKREAWKVTRSETTTTNAQPTATQDGDGRWRWHAPDGDPQPAGSPRSLMAFKSRAEALADFALHVGAPRDATGRRVMSKDYLRRMISAVALPCEACADVFFGGVYWHRRGADGANWGVAIMNGAGDYPGCTACVFEAKEDLRRRYAIVDEG